MKRLFLTFLFLAFLVPGAAVAEGVPDTGMAAEREAGGILYAKMCSGCHGDEGNGQGPAREYLRPVPRDFTSGSFKSRQTPSGEMPSTSDLFRSTKYGMPFTTMPPFPRLSDSEIKDIVYYLKSFDSFFSDPASVVDTLDIGVPPPVTPVSIAKGRVLYLKNGCQSCHGDVARGEGLSASSQEDAAGKPLRPADLSRRWTFRCGSSLPDIFRTIHRGMDGTPMAAYGSLITKDDLWCVTQYIHSLSGSRPEYADRIIARPVDGPIEADMGEALFSLAQPALLPVVGQVIEPGRCFFPTVHSLEVRAVYNASDIAFMLVWRDISPQQLGGNSPVMEVPNFIPDAETPSEEFSDAAAVQMPSAMPAGFESPYFLLGDSVRSVDVWFADLAGKKADVYVGGGRGRLAKSGDSVSVYSRYRDGEWAVIFKQSRVQPRGFAFEDGAWQPVAFSVWDGLNKERGSSRGITSWVQLYLQSPHGFSPLAKGAVSALAVLLLELAVVLLMKSAKRKDTSS